MPKRNEMRVSHSKREVETKIRDSALIEKKRLQIAVGASKLFIQKGYSRTSIREISRAADLSIGNLYDYITKKEDVLYLVFDSFHSIWVSRLEEDGVFEIEDPVEQLNTALRKMLELVDDYRDMVLLMYTESKLLPREFLRIILKKESGLVRCFEKILRRGVKKGVFRSDDPFLLANIIVYLFSMEPLRGWNLKKRYRTEEISEGLLKFVTDSVIR